MKNICIINDLLDIWRIRNPQEKRFTWHQKTPREEVNREYSEAKLLRRQLFEVSEIRASCHSSREGSDGSAEEGWISLD